VRLFSVLVCGASFLGSILLRGAPFLGSILGPISVHGASFLGSLLVRGAPFLGSILVCGVWCADFRADFGARCAFLSSQDWKGLGGIEPEACRI